MRDEFLGERRGVNSLPNRFFGDGDTLKRQYGGGSSEHVCRSGKLRNRLQRCGLQIWARTVSAKSGRCESASRITNREGLL